MESTQLHNINKEELQALIAESVSQALKNLSISPGAQEKYLTRQQVADMFDVSILTVSNWTNEGKIISYQLGGRIYYKLSDIEAGMKPVAKSKNMSRMITDVEYEELLILRKYKKLQDDTRDKINELGEFVERLSVFAGNISKAGVKKAPAKAKKETVSERNERFEKMLRRIK